MLNDVGLKADDVILFLDFSASASAQRSREGLLCFIRPRIHNLQQGVCSIKNGE